MNLLGTFKRDAMAQPSVAETKPLRELPLNLRSELG